MTVQTNDHGLLATILPSIDACLSVRDSAGVVFKKVYLLTRTWSGTQPGDGSATDKSVQMLPSPGVKDYSQDVRLREGGSVKAGDIVLKNVSKNSFQLSQLDGTSTAGNIEQLFLVGDKVYNVINVTEKPVTWDVQLRELTNQTRY